MASLSLVRNVIRAGANEGAGTVDDAPREHSGDRVATLGLAGECDGRDRTGVAVQRARKGPSQVALVCADPVGLVEGAVAGYREGVVDSHNLIGQRPAVPSSALAEALHVRSYPVHQVARLGLARVSALAAVASRNNGSTTSPAADVTTATPSAGSHPARCCSARRLPSASLGLAPFGA